LVPSSQDDVASKNTIGYRNPCLNNLKRLPFQAAGVKRLAMAVSEALEDAMDERAVRSSAWVSRSFDPVGKVWRTSIPPHVVAPRNPMMKVSSSVKRIALGPLQAIRQFSFQNLHENQNRTMW
jgi:hypothetical protein